MEQTIQEKSFAFAIRIVNLCKYLRDEQKEYESIMIDCSEIEKLLISIIKTAKQ